ncbi:hypothetical protein [Desulfuromonas sp. AOP6]|uniref:hypothetical protein n=1 Tax=Desulfuromonas sp. AOP6 TaxID=1566351 RepID=UPI001277BCF5|nr:hypothetical protein [Desulfuromonas sp. AOP6]BCA79060.1 hypothetical protein AOP6_0847 [Desulfuromonas sp. AOP6]
MARKESSYSVFKGNDIRGAGCPTVITAISFPKFNSGTFLGEIYVFLRGREYKFLEEEITYQLCKEAEEFEAIDREFMEQEILGRARFALSLYLTEIYENTNNLFYLQSQYDLRQVDDKELLRVWFEGRFKNEIIKISQESSCSPLKKLLTSYRDIPHLVFDK